MDDLNISRLYIVHVALVWRCVDLGCLGDPCFLHLQGKVIPPVPLPICAILCSMGGVATSHMHTYHREHLTLRRLMSYIYIYIWSTHS